MISDLNKGITEILYNYLNLPTQISFANGNSIEYLYNAAGQKIEKKVHDTQNNTLKQVEYLDGFQYAGGILQFFPTAEGYVAATESTELLNPYIYNYVYNYTDHLGNIRLSYTKDPVSGDLEIMEENHYYPFGLKHSVYADPKQMYKLDDEEENLARPTYVYETEYQYKYNGKEWQDELNLNVYDYGARNYDPAIGRWMNSDPLSDEAPNWTPYRFAFNNPLYFNDPTGLFEDDYQLHDDGSVTLIQKKTDDKSDTLYASNSDGSVDKSRSVTVQKEKASDSSVIGELSTNVTASDNSKFPDGIRSGSTSNASDAFKVYSFVAKNSSVEWGMNGYFSNGKYSFDIFTGHNSSFTPSPIDIAGNNFINLEFIIHSHKSRNSPSEGTYPDDYDVAAAINRAYRNVVGGKLDESSYPRYFMLHAPDPDKGSMTLWKYWASPDRNADGHVPAGSRNIGNVNSLSLDTLNK